MIDSTSVYVEFFFSARSDERIICTVERVVYFIEKFNHAIDVHIFEKRTLLLVLHSNFHNSETEKLTNLVQARRLSTDKLVRGYLFDYVRF